MAAHKASLTSAKKENAFSPDVWAVFSHDRFVWSAVSFTYFTVLGVEPRASCTLGKLPTTDLCLLSPFRTFCFEVGSSHSTAQASLELTSLPRQSLIRSPPAQPPGSQAYAISPNLAERFPCAVERRVSEAASVLMKDGARNTWIRKQLNVCKSLCWGKVATIG